MAKYFVHACAKRLTRSSGSVNFDIVSFTRTFSNSNPSRFLLE
ncbi:hypothetical protein BRCON_0715 [Candidatus Sumerlaea chitinivorans]|uniref:Uncharacterized protein n=1 Tax=Sumerlaea chitinivorans TaxID=2250252 RepID=A0A2Z4Y449_SUMC1|nr:hypothetical protein BRCON_0715 [Candidatus Sumerlaea chitinivorans]